MSVKPHLKTKATICFFGSYTLSHRNNTLLRGLREHGYEVLECRDTSSVTVVRLVRLFYKLWNLRGTYEVLMIGFPNHQLVPLVKICVRKPIIFDPFISLYNTGVEDRKLLRPYSYRALKAKLIDRWSLRSADYILTDTTAHAQYLAHMYNVELRKFTTVPVGADPDVFVPLAQHTYDRTTFRVKFYGSYSPLQGIQYILKAAKLVSEHDDIHFSLLGSGQTLAEMKALAAELRLSNVTFIDERVPLEEVVTFLQNASVCLGIFGDTNKTNNVVPHKVYDALALGKPVISARTDAIQESFTDKSDILLCERANERDLADKILLLKGDSVLQQTLAKNARRLFEEKFTPYNTVTPLTKLIDTITYARTS